MPKTQQHEDHLPAGLILRHAVRADGPLPARSSGRAGAPPSRAAMPVRVAALAFALAAWSLTGAVRCLRGGDRSPSAPMLPQELQDRIRRVIRTGLTTRGLVIASLSVRFMVSLLESVCAGRAFLPAIVSMTRPPGMQAAGAAYLLLYNVMFIVPLLAILAMAYVGVRSRTLGTMLRKRLALAKLGMAGVLAGLGVLLIAIP